MKRYSYNMQIRNLLVRAVYCIDYASCDSPFLREIIE